MKRVHFTTALNNNEEISGTFDFVRGPYQRAGQKRDAMFKILRNGAITRVHVFNPDYKILSGEGASEQAAHDEETKAPEINVEELGARIERRFRVMSKLTEGIVHGNIRALIMSGAAGIGKSYNLEERLKKAEQKGEINKYTILKGRISAVALYAQLYLHQDKGDVLVLDDNDIIFQDELSLNILKGALDTGEKRHLSWKTASTWLEENGIEDEFDFNGCCCFVTNLDFDRMIERGSVLAPHFKALLSRSTYLDLLIHSPLEIMIRIEQVVKNTAILDTQGIDDDQKELMMSWLWDNYNHMRELSLRSVLKIGSFMNTDMSDWQEMTEVTMLKSKL